MLHKVQFSRLGLARILPHLIVLSFVGCAAAIMAWVGWLTWIDLTNWGKDLGSIFFGSRTGEPISLGIGMTVIHYFLIGMLCLSLGVILFIRNRIAAKRTEQDMWINVPRMEKKQTVSTTPAVVKSNGKEENAVAREERFFSGCLHHFGYLSTRPKESPIPQECILCQRLGDCMVATIYVKSAEEQ